jgi:hypothetical protein
MLLMGSHDREYLHSTVSLSHQFKTVAFCYEVPLRNISATRLMILMFTM